MLGIKGAFPYGNRLVIGFLRLVGLINAAIWFGAAVFFAFAAAPVATSEAMGSLLGPRNFPYFSASVYHLIAGKYYALHLICSVIALMHMATEWVYLGKNPRRVWVVMLLGLTLLGGLEDFILQSHLKDLHRTAFVAPGASRATRGRQARLYGLECHLPFLSIHNGRRLRCLPVAHGQPPRSCPVCPRRQIQRLTNYRIRRV